MYSYEIFETFIIHNNQTAHWKLVTYSMKLSYSMALLFPPVLSNLETSKSNITGETENPRPYSASRSSDTSILPLLSLSYRSNISWRVPNNDNLTMNNGSL